MRSSRLRPRSDRTPRSSRCSTACGISTRSTRNSAVNGCSAASAPSRRRSTSSARWCSCSRCSRSISASATAGCRSGSRHRRHLRQRQVRRVASENILQEMWEKWVFLASLAASTSLMRTSVGNILAAPGGRDFLLGILDECRRDREAAGYSPRAPFVERNWHAHHRRLAAERVDVPRHQGGPARSKPIT